MRRRSYQEKAHTRRKPIPGESSYQEKAHTSRRLIPEDSAYQEKAHTRRKLIPGESSYQEKPDIGRMTRGYKKNLAMRRRLKITRKG